MREMKKLTIENFANELASNSPAPGGGSIAALSSTLAASLASMVFNLTVGKKAYLAYDDDTKMKIDKGITEAGNMKEEFLSLMDEDTEAFDEVMAGFKLPKETEEEKALRSNKIQEAYKKATLVPLKVAEKTLDIFTLLEIAVKYGNANAISDAGVGALIALTGLEAAILNVKINLPSIKDPDFVSKVKEKCDVILKSGTTSKECLLEIVKNKL
ncbi:MAG: methenyltetrahydrofolate cyclohydrolase [Clostridiales bacterium]|jgi:formiminotetrahydrofolate cyclodeaminase|nr:methenyltetrahydrofolate cyclohydrolase [Clostridiales bacterium]